jgi:ATP-binding cassette subfamily B protein RaxB
MNAALHLGWSTRRVPIVLQTEAAECGLACLAMVAGAHGHQVDLPTLRTRFSVSLKGATMADLVRMAGSLQLTPRGVRAELVHLERLPTPCIQI